MKKALAILGAMILVLLIGVGGAFLHFSQAGARLDASSKAYVDAVVPAIVRNWSIQALEERASPQYLKVARHDEMALLFAKLSQLGTLEHYDGAKGDSNIAYTPRNGKVVSARYLAHARFENGEADIRVTLIQMKDEWRILGFFVNSPLFLKPGK